MSKNIKIVIYSVMLIFGIIWFVASIGSLFAVGGDGGTQSAITQGTWNAKVQADREVKEAQAEVDQSIAELNEALEEILAYNRNN